MPFQTGIPMLDELLGGGMKENSSLLICSLPGVESIQFAQQMFYHQLKAGAHALYHVNDKKAQIVRYLFDKYDWNLAGYSKKGRLHFVDAYSALIASQPESRYFVDNPSDIIGIFKVVSKALDEVHNSRNLYLIDNLSTMLDQCGTDPFVVDHIRKNISAIKQSNFSIVSLMTLWPYPKETIEKIRDMFDYVIDLKAIERNVILRYYFSVAKGGKRRDIPFVVERPGGIKIYIPKILVTGPYHAGKTSFVHSASQKAISVNRIGTTVALDHGHVDHKGFAVDLWGTPGQERFDPILDTLGGESIGVIIVIDSTDPKSFKRAKDMIAITETTSLPQVIVANKANLKGALKPESIRRKMGLNSSIPIIPIRAADLPKDKQDNWQPLRQDDIDKALDTLFSQII